ncbi:MAG: hypothetical protein Q4D96_09180 [Propionibacteriaceae bacterium]|nr:hypothetical protein [Propionibacteriaceae bacterium]
METARTRLATAETAQGTALLKLVDEFKVSLQEIAATCDLELKEIRTMLKAARSSTTNDDQQQTPSTEPADSPTPPDAPTAAPDDQSPRS